MERRRTLRTRSLGRGSEGKLRAPRDSTPYLLIPLAPPLQLCVNTVPWQEHPERHYGLPLSIPLVSGQEREASETEVMQTRGSLGTKQELIAKGLWTQRGP